MTPTNEQIVAEAWVRYRKANTARAVIGEYKPLDHFVIEVVRENWTPPEPVDPDLIAVLEFLSKRHPGSNYYHSETAKIDALTQTCLAAYKAGRNQEQERAKVLVECVEVNAFAGVNRYLAQQALAKYRGEA